MKTRITAATTAVATFLLALFVGVAPAQAAPTTTPAAATTHAATHDRTVPAAVATPRLPAVSVGDGTGGIITGRVGFATSSTATPTFGGNAVDVYVYHQTPDGDLEPITPDTAFPLGAGQWNTGNGTFATPALEPGTYTLYFVPSDDSFGSEFYDNARYFAERTDVVLAGGETKALGDQVLRPRYFDMARVSGPSRWDTAVAVSQTLFPDAGAAPIVYLANGENFPDALSAGPAAIRDHGVLLSTKSNWLPPMVATELQRLAPTQIKVIGGTGVINDAVLAQVAGLLPHATITRIAGSSRWATSEAVVRASFGTSGAPTVFVATGQNYPDALAAGPAAGALDSPLILIDGTAKALTSETKKLLSDLHTNHVYVVGGTGVISAAIETQLKGLVGSANVERLSGSSRWATAAAVNDAVFPGQEQALLASGNGFADALTGAPLAGAIGAPLFLAAKDCIPSDAAVSLWYGGTVGIWLVGGTGVLSDNVSDLAVCDY